MLIPLTQGKFAIIDDKDWDLVKDYKWCANKGGNTFYAQTTIYKPDGKQTLIMHRLILGLKSGEHCDHINHDGCDNRRSNIRSVTRQQNHMNQQKHKNYSSIYKGVFFHKTSKCWCAQIRFNTKAIYLGSFKSEIEGAIAYDAKARELFGEFAYLNFPD